MASPKCQAVSRTYILFLRAKEDYELEKFSMAISLYIIDLASSRNYSHSLQQFIDQLYSYPVSLEVHQGRMNSFSSYFCQFAIMARVAAVEEKVAPQHHVATVAT